MAARRRAAGLPVTHCQSLLVRAESASIISAPAVTHWQ
jgi:hypothetical protein